MQALNAWRPMALLLLSLFACAARAGDPTVVHTFAVEEGTAERLIVGPDGALYGALSGGEIFRYTTGGAYSVVATGVSASGLAMGLDGNLYAVTAGGGAFGKGSVVRITLGGAKTTIASFDGTNGQAPASIVRAQDGNFYGTAAGGALFKVTPGGVLTKLASVFVPSDLLAGTDGNLYGASGEQFYQVCCGSLFRLTAAGVVTTLHTMQGSDGWYPAGGLVQAPNGTLYGVTRGAVPLGLGGPAYTGELFQLAPDGSNFEQVVAFDTWRGSSQRPLYAMDGTLFGVVEQEVGYPPETFRVHPQTGQYQRLFYGGAAELTQLADGNIYGLDHGAPSAQFPARLLRLKRVTSLTSKGTISIAAAPGQVKLNASAVLKDDMSGQGLAGQTLRFVRKGQAYCTAVTDATGTATCKATVKDNLLSATGYQVVFNGTGTYDSSFVNGVFVCAGNVCR